MPDSSGLRMRKAGLEYINISRANVGGTAEIYIFILLLKIITFVPFVRIITYGAKVFFYLYLFFLFFNLQEETFYEKHSAQNISSGERTPEVMV